ncbi:unnamed protein product [Cunninghamella echinulata]
MEKINGIRTMSTKDLPPPSGAELIATSLKTQGVEVIFGIVGIPVVEIADACQAVGIRFIGFRNDNQLHMQLQLMAI